MVSGCRNDAENNFGIHLRKPTTRAVYAPECETYLCKDHAEGGGTWRIDFTPRSDGKVEPSFQEAVSQNAV
jgi:hypothetical protein